MPMMDSFEYSGFLLEHGIQIGVVVVCVLISAVLLSVCTRIGSMYRKNAHDMAALIKAGLPMVPPTEPVHPLLKCHTRLFPLVDAYTSTNYLVELSRLLNSDIFVVSFITGAPRLLVSSLEGIRHIQLINQRNYVRPQLARLNLEDVVGASSVILAEGHEHARLRRMVHSMFKASSLLDAAPIFYKLAAELVDQWSQSCVATKDGIQPHIERRMVNFALDAILQYSFRSCSLTDQLAESYRVIFGGEADPFILVLLQKLMFPWLKWTSRTLRKRNKAVQNVRDLSRKVVEERQLKRAMTADHAKEPQDMLDKLLQAQDPQDPSGSVLTYEEITDQILTNFSAGQATTSVVLSWGLWVLASNFQFQQTLYNEVCKLYSSKEYLACTTDGQRLDKLDKLEYLNWFIYELMRLYSPIPFITRVAVEDDIIDGWNIPQGTTCLVDVSVLMRSRSVFGADVDDFIPERWRNEPDNESDAQVLAQREVLSILPFNIGPHGCLGRRFALYEIKVVLSEVVTHFILSLPTPIQIPRRRGFLGSPDNVTLRMLKRENK